MVKRIRKDSKQIGKRLGTIHYLKFTTMALYQKVRLMMSLLMQQQRSRILVHSTRYGHYRIHVCLHICTYYVDARQIFNGSFSATNAKQADPRRLSFIDNRTSLSSTSSPSSNASSYCVVLFVKSYKRTSSRASLSSSGSTKNVVLLALLSITKERFC